MTGALGQIGSELVQTLRERYGEASVVASDVRMPQRDSPTGNGPFEFLDVTNQRQFNDVVRKHNIDCVYHLAAILSAVAEEKPLVAWDINMGGLYCALEVARESGCALFTPSSIAAFGPSTPRDQTPQDTIQRPNSMYGVTKVSGELLCDYYHKRFGVDVRGVRYPGLISHVALPGGGTTDYAVEIYYEAVRHERYTCFLAEETRLPMMYMPDAIKAAIDLMHADGSRLKHRNSFNVTAFDFTPVELADAITKYVPDFRISYEVDEVRQGLADSWPRSIDDSAARSEWDWSPDYDVDAMTLDMLENLRKKMG